jgi:hypothetical protein
MSATHTPSEARKVAEILRRRLLDMEDWTDDYVFRLAMRACCDWSLVEPEGDWHLPVERVRARQGPSAAAIPSSFVFHDQYARARGDQQASEAFVPTRAGASRARRGTRTAASCSIRHRVGPWARSPHGSTGRRRIRTSSILT